MGGPPHGLFGTFVPTLEQVEPDAREADDDQERDAARVVDDSQHVGDATPLADCCL